MGTDLKGEIPLTNKAGKRWNSMAGPWEKFQKSGGEKNAAQTEDGPWGQFKQKSQQVVIPSADEVMKEKFKPGLLDAAGLALAQGLSGKFGGLATGLLTGDLKEAQQAYKATEAAHPLVYNAVETAGNIAGPGKFIKGPAAFMGLAGASKLAESEGINSENIGSQLADAATAAVTQGLVGKLLGGFPSKGISNSASTGGLYDAAMTKSPGLLQKIANSELGKEMVSAFSGPRGRIAMALAKSGLAPFKAAAKFMGDNPNIGRGLGMKSGDLAGHLSKDLLRNE